MVLACPIGYTANNLGCGVHRCCDDVSCSVNIVGPCVCATYGDPSPSQPGWDYSYLAKCNGATVDGYQTCETIFDLEYASSCYCRHRKPGDVGKIGDQLPGNRIFNTDDQCILFKAKGTAPTKREAEDATENIVKRSGAVVRGRPGGVVVLAGQLLGLMLVVQLMWR